MSRRIVVVDSEDLFRTAYQNHRDVELDATHAYLTLDGITFKAAIPETVTTA